MAAASTLVAVQATYKAAKEAFVSDNLGSSIVSINAVSFSALTAYAIYALAAPRLRHPSPLLDYAVTVLPLLLSVTIAATHVLALNATLAVLAILLYSSSPRPRFIGPTRPRRKPAGKWLDETDSEDEPERRQHTLAQASSLSTNLVKLPSELVATDMKSREASLTATLQEPKHQPGSKKRHSPTPSTHTHTAIDIASTPDSPTTGAFSQYSPANYPSPQRDRNVSNTRRNSDRADTDTPTQSTSSQHLPFLSVYRAHMMIMTAHCILAVDFTIFPRYFGKCENFGTSLMDVGVGSFVFSLGLVSSRSFSVSSPKQNIVLSIAQSLRKAAPVLALGLVRVVMVKGSDYPEHVTEYGVHWNFFFTLGLLPCLGMLFLPARRHIARWSNLALLLSVGHQAVLSLSPLQDFVLSTARPGLVGLNKEGLTSLPGYSAIFLFGLSVGDHVVRASAPISTEKSPHDIPDYQVREYATKRRTELAMQLFGYAFASWTSLALARFFGLPVSRRLANFPYVLWTIAYNSSFLLGYLALELWLMPPTDQHATDNATPACPPLLDAVNNNGLAVFLAANLLTGLVNVSIRTIYTPTSTAMAVLVAYSASVCAIAWAIRGVRLKL